MIFCIALFLIALVVIAELTGSHAKKAAVASSPATGAERISHAHHTADHDFAARTVYDPDPSLPDINGHSGAVYVLVSSQDGLILSYAMNLPAGTTLHAATRTAQAEFPRDVRLLWIAHKNACVQAQFASDILGHVLVRPAIGLGGTATPAGSPGC